MARDTFSTNEKSVLVLGGTMYKITKQPPKFFYIFYSFVNKFFLKHSLFTSTGFICIGWKPNFISEFACNKTTFTFLFEKELK